MKAVICPICNGTGTYSTKPTANGGGHLEYRCRCHGCGGKGWVEVSEEQPAYPQYEVPPNTC